jgi:hypothetical protein
MAMMTNYGLYQVKDDEPEHCLTTDYCEFCRPGPFESDHERTWRLEQAIRNAEQGDFGAEYDPALAQEYPHP